MRALISRITLSLLVTAQALAGTPVPTALPGTITPAAALSASNPDAATPAERLANDLRAGRLANSTGHFEEAETSFRLALDLQTGELESGKEAVASTLLELALNVSNQGRADEALALFRRAEPGVQASANPMMRARFATYRALDSANNGDFVNGLRFAIDSVEQWGAIAEERQNQGAQNTDVNLANGELANALTLQARFLVRQDNLVGAYGAASHALMVLGKHKDVPQRLRADALLALGEVSAGQGRISAAETYFKSAMTIRRQLFGEGGPTIQALAALARAYQHEGLNTSAIVTYREVFRMARALPSSAGVFTADMLVPFAAAITATAETISDPDQRLGLYTEGFDAFQLVQSAVVDRTIAQAAARISATTPALAALIGSMQDHQRLADLARFKLTFQQSLPDEERSGEEVAKTKAELARELSAVAGLRQRVSGQFPAYDALAAPRPLQLDQLRSLLHPREGVLSFLIGRDQSFAELVMRDGVMIVPVPEGQQGLHDTVVSLRRALEVQGGAIAEFNLSEANHLFDELLGGLKPQLAKLDHLVIVPGGPLANLPFGLLVTAPVDSDDYSKAPWLLRDLSLAYTPSLHSFGQLRAARPGTRPSQPLLGFGNPVLLGNVGAKAGAAGMTDLLGSCRQGGPMPPELLRELTPLPDTVRELEAVAQALGATSASLSTGAEASEAKLYARPLSDYRVLYFATHGLLPGELRCQAEPGLVLTPPIVPAMDKASDGLLETSEIAGLRLNADLVVLSACNTAGGAGGPGGGAALSGLAEAFFHAGARNMVVSHWQVPSAATTELMSGLFKTWSSGGAGQTVGDALRKSQLALVANESTAHPFFWAAFVAVGDGHGQPSGGNATLAQ